MSDMASFSKTMTTGPRSPTNVRSLARLLRYLLAALKVGEGQIIATLRRSVVQLLESPHVAELLRFVFLGTFIETGRQLGQSVMDWVQHLFIVEATFVRGDFAYDWVSRYLADLNTWSESRVFQVIVQNPLNAHASAETSRHADDVPGRPKQLYQPNPGSPVFIKWRKHWITIILGKAESYERRVMSPSLPSGSDIAQSLTLRKAGDNDILIVWSRNRRILDDFVEEARQHYFSSEKPPRQLPMLPDPSRTVLTVRFVQGDRSYDWMLAWIKAQNVFETAVHLEITTQPADLSSDISAGGDKDESKDKDIMSFRPASGTKQLVSWRGHWFQFDTNLSLDPDMDRRWGSGHGGQARGVLDVTVHSNDRTVITELVKAAREDYAKMTMSKVTVHTADAGGSWLSSTSKTRRALSTLFLPEGSKEMLLNDMEEFLRSKDWYTWGGVPHRRGYLLYGEPGTGKSSTIHALASVLGLEIYYIQLSSRGLDDYQLQRLFNSAPPRSILLLEDIDCAFGGEDDDEDNSKPNFVVLAGRSRAIRSGNGRVTFSGLLNCLDSVISGEGRFVFATTNHIEKLDPALMRPGRMDIKIEYKLASRSQIYETFLRFFLLPIVGMKDSNTSAEGTTNGEPADPRIESTGTETPPAGGVYSHAEVAALATRFASLVPEYKYSIAQVQGYLIRKRNDPAKALEEVGIWMKEQDEEKRMLEIKRGEKEREKREKAERKRGVQERGAGVNAIEK